MAAQVWQGIADQVEKKIMKVRHVDTHGPRVKLIMRFTSINRQTAKIKVSQENIDWQHKCELFLAWWAHNSSSH